LQENLCHEVINRFVEKVQPKGAMVVMRAIHGCMACRGVKQANGAGMITSALSGVFAEKESTKLEGLQLIDLSISLSK
jgi:GTP cyclohydrolase I